MERGIEKNLEKVRSSNFLIKVSNNPHFKTLMDIVIQFNIATKSGERIFFRILRLFCIFLNSIEEIEINF